jgi:hypothetical protein
VFVQLALGEAETSPITKAAETYVALGRSGSSPGCAHCRAVMPDTNPIGLIHKGLDTSSWDAIEVSTMRRVSMADLRNARLC